MPASSVRSLSLSMLNLLATRQEQRSEQTAWRRGDAAISFSELYVNRIGPHGALLTDPRRELVGGGLAGGIAQRGEHDVRWEAGAIAADEGPFAFAGEAAGGEAEEGDSTRSSFHSTCSSLTPVP